MDPHAEPQSLISRYLPRPVISWLADAPDQRERLVDGSLLFADVSGFTALSERLAREGRVGAEVLADTISACFARLLATAYSNGGSLLKFGGDALLLLFTGDAHCSRAANAAFGMRRELRAMKAVATRDQGGRVRLGMSIGLHTGPIHLFLVGDVCRELVVTGPAATEVVRMEALADKGEIVASQAAALALGSSVVGERKGDGYLLRREPPGVLAPPERTSPPTSDRLLLGLPPWQRALAMSGSDDPQHRNVVIAFCKFSGTDALIRDSGSSCAADELHSLVVDAHATAEQHGVFVLGTDVDRDGGKLLLVGGAPTTTGADEEGVLLAARQILQPSRRLAIRIGVNAGSAFAGDIGPAYRRTYTAMGDAVNVAARVMAHAEPGQVLATPAVLQRCRTPFTAHPVDPFMVKGKSHPVRASVVGPPSRRRRDEAVALPMVGRDVELQAIVDAWQSARLGYGRGVIVLGEPGIGKTRLMVEAASRVDGTRLDVVCEQYAALTAYSAVRQLLVLALGAAPTTSPDALRERLVEVVARELPAMRRWLPLVGLVLGVELPMTSAVADLDERFLRERLEEVVLELLAALLATPTVILVEDAHFMDEASASLFGRALMRVTSSPWLILIARRDLPRGHTIGDGGDVEVIRLEALHRNAVTALAETLIDDQTAFAPEVVDSLVERAGGNPLFLNELIAAREQAGEGELPDSLEGVILSRIDALPPKDRTLLRRLSVFGVSFSHDIARAVFDDEFPAEDDAAWERLADFLDVGAFRQMSFKHALLMEGAYNSLPFRVRESLHAAVGETIESRAGAATADHAEVLSQHFFRARRYEKAWSYSRIAANRAQAVYANHVAARFLDLAIDAGRRVEGLAGTELAAVHEAHGDALRRMGRLPEAAAAYARARRLSADDAVAVSRLMQKQAGVRQQEGAFPQALRWLRRAADVLHHARSEAAGQQRAKVAVARASVAKDQRHPKVLIRWCEQARRLAEDAGDLDALAHSLFLLDHGFVLLGRPDQAVHSTQALALYEQLGNLWGQAAILNNLGGYAYWRGDWEEAVGLYRRGREVFERIGDVCNCALSLDNVGEIRSDQGRYDEAEELFVEAVAVRQRVQDRAKIAYALSNLGRLRTRQDRFDEALTLLSQARDMSQSVGVSWDAVEAGVRMVECLVHSGEVEAAQDLAVALADARAARPDRAQQGTLRRLVGYTYLFSDDLDAAGAEFELSLADARAVGLVIEEAMALRALGHLARAGQRDPSPHLATAQKLLDSLGVRRVAEPRWLTAPSAIPRQAGLASQHRLQPS